MAAAVGTEEMRAELPVGPEQEEGETDGGNGEEIAGRNGYRSPGQNRHARQRHARRPHPQEGDQEVYRPHGRRNAEENHAERIEVDVRAGVELLERIGDVIEPAVVRDGAGKEARVHEEPGRQIDPVGKGVQPRERHVAGAEHQREKVVAEARENRLRVEEDHRNGVRGKELVVLLRGDQRLVWSGELQADRERFQAAEDEKEEGRYDVTDANLLVVDGGDPSIETGLRRPDRFQRGGGGQVVVCGQDAWSAIIFSGGHDRPISASEETPVCALAPAPRAGASASVRQASGLAGRRSSRRGSRGCLEACRQRSWSAT